MKEDKKQSAWKWPSLYDEIIEIIILHELKLPSASWEKMRI